MTLMFPVRSPGRPRIRTDEQRRTIRAMWREANADRINRYKSAYRKEHREQIRQGFRDWYARNKHRVSARRVVRLSLPKAFQELSCRPWRSVTSSTEPTK